ncbi:hypothetical protein COCNU_01G008260 [Cocos nucifera]|uniref:Uncharacterized protein n=1 Tax=Cocos nucifera TaxID=13894 RepID=A0A8K0MUI9_COCNU|nr:hypothetical protein COCNU_01G008260 [Cocos nucifera]
MGLELVDGGLPCLPPIRTTGNHTNKPVDEPQPVSSPKNEVECVTPKSEEHVLKPALVCPPAPRKPPPVKRKVEPPPQGFHPVPRDLTSIFLALPSKKIRVG